MEREAKGYMKLYDIPQGSKLMLAIDDTGTGTYEMEPCTFHHLDGMYSYCTVDRLEGKENGVFHLAASTPLNKVGEHYEIEGNALEV